MALLKNRLLDSLDKLRETIKEENYLQHGKTPSVCTDAVLKEIAKKKPLKISDFLAISGIGKAFMDKYASRFLGEILKHQNESVKDVQVSETAFKVLDHYKDRLTNISRRNPNLYMGRIIKKTSFDLSVLDSSLELIDFLTTKKTNKLDLNFLETSKGETVERNITTLYRETNKAEKEYGSYDLYIAYPYIEGIFKKDRFAIKAPLLYFPVKLVRDKRNFYIKKDKDKDIIFNRDLLLATSKMEKKDIDSNTPYISSFNQKTLHDVIIPFYKNNGIDIKKSAVDFSFVCIRNCAVLIPYTPPRIPATAIPSSIMPSAISHASGRFADSLNAALAICLLDSLSTSSTVAA